MSDRDPNMDYVYTKSTRGGAQVEYHIVKTPAYKDKGWYRTVGSMNAFRNRTLKRQVRQVNLPDGGTGYVGLRLSFRWSAESFREHEFRKAIYANTGGRMLDGPEIHHESIWDFYKHIGFDYKKNRFDVEPVEIK